MPLEDPQPIPSLSSRGSASNPEPLRITPDLGRPEPARLILLSTTTTMATMAISSNIVAKARTLARSPAFDYVKTALFVYVLLTRLLQARRHVRARGLVPTLRDFWTWLSQVRGTLYVLLSRSPNMFRAPSK